MRISIREKGEFVRHQTDKTLSLNTMWRFTPKPDWLSSQFSRPFTITQPIKYSDFIFYSSVFRRPSLELRASKWWPIGFCSKVPASSSYSLPFDYFFKSYPGFLGSFKSVLLEGVIFRRILVSWHTRTSHQHLMSCYMSGYLTSIWCPAIWDSSQMSSIMQGHLHKICVLFMGLRS
jgi:hypothetical protein